eukprot:137003-Rhodomonas_salina.1
MVLPLGSDLPRFLYARATRCPVVTERTMLQLSSDLVYSATITLRNSYDMPGSKLAYGATTRFYTIQYCYLNYYKKGGKDGEVKEVMSAICLRVCHAMSGTELAYAASSDYAMLGDVRY